MKLNSTQTTPQSCGIDLHLTVKVVCLLAYIFMTVIHTFPATFLLIFVMMITKLLVALALENHMQEKCQQFSKTLNLILKMALKVILSKEQKDLPLVDLETMKDWDKYLIGMVPLQVNQDKQLLETSHFIQVIYVNLSHIGAT